MLEAGSSVELCGGTHVRATGDIGTIKVVSEASIGSNLRRIEALTGANSVALFQEYERDIDDVAELLGATASTVKENAEKRIAQIKALEEENRALRAQLAVGRAGELAAAAPDGVVVARVDDLTPADLRDLAVAVRQQAGIRRVVLAGTTTTGGVSIVAAVRPSEGIAAADLIRDAAKAVGGGGGGKGDIATAGGKDPEGLDDALRLALEAANA